MALLKKIKILTVAIAVSIAPVVIYNRYTSAVNYSAYCVSEACRKAADEEAAANEKSEAAQAAADSLAGAIAALNAEIKSLEAKIKTNEIIAADLAQQIKVTEAKLKQQQNALAELLINMHFDSDDDAITILAGSESISDLAEKQSRQEVAKKEVASSSEQIKKTKAELEDQKASIDELIAEAQESRAQIQQKKSEQTSLMQRYQGDAASYAAYAAEQRKIKQDEIANEIASRNKSGVVTYDGLDSYPYRDRCPSGLDDWNNYWYGSPFQCECTDYAGWKMTEYTGYSIQWLMNNLSGFRDITWSVLGYASSTWGNAKNWARVAEEIGHTYSEIGFHISSEPGNNTIGVQTDGSTGHVVWVESVNSNGTINLTEYNNWGSAASHMPGDFGARNAVPYTDFDAFIYFDYF